LKTFKRIPKPIFILVSTLVCLVLFSSLWREEKSLLATNGGAAHGQPELLGIANEAYRSTLESQISEVRLISERERERLAVTQNAEAKKEEEEGDQSEPHQLEAVERGDRNYTFFDIEIAGVPKGRIVFEIYHDISPLAGENFRSLCTGEKGGVVPAGKEGAGKTYWFKDRYFYRIIDQFIDQTGTGTESIYGGQFKDDKGGLERLKHDRPGLLSMANYGPDTNTSHFSILMAPAPHLDGKYVIFGQVISGFEIAKEINSYAKGKPENTAGEEIGAKIVHAGQCKDVECKE
jgi:peptidyl-prolyl isomerase D